MNEGEEDMSQQRLQDKKIAVAGIGGVGGYLAGMLGRVWPDLTLLARGKRLKTLREKGLVLHSDYKGEISVKTGNVMPADEMGEQDVIFVCVKNYSLEDVIAFAEKTGSAETVVIPILNIYGTGERMQKRLPFLAVTDGCIYVAAHVSAPGEITHGGDIFRVVYGLRPGQEPGETALRRLFQIKQDLDHAGISGEYSDNIRRDTFKKFMYTSPMAAAGEYFHAQAGVFQKEGEPRDTFIAMDRELLCLSEAMGLGVPADMVEVNLDILADLSPEAGTSMQRDIAKGGKSEIEGLVYAVEDMAAAYHVDMPVYHKIIEGLKARGLK